MIEVTMYVKDAWMDRSLGVATLVYDNGKFGVGISIRNFKDSFNKAVGKDIARERALANLEANPFTQISDIVNRFRDEFYRTLPGAPFTKVAIFESRYHCIKEEMCFKMAKEFMARDRN